MAPSVGIWTAARFIIALALMVTKQTSLADSVSQTVILQLKYGPGTKMPDADTDQYHTKAFFASSVEWFLAGMLSKVGEESIFSRLKIYRVAINSQAVGKPANQVTAQSRAGNTGDRSLTESLEKFVVSSTTKSNRLLQSLLPLYVNMTITGNYAPTSAQPNIDQQELEDVILHLFNDKGGELIEKLHDLTVPYFKNVTQIRAVSSSSLSASSNSEVVPTEEAKDAYYRKVAAISAIVLGAVGMVLIGAIAYKIYRSRDEYEQVNTKLDKHETDLSSLPPPPYYSTQSQYSGVSNMNSLENRNPYLQTPATPQQYRTSAEYYGKQEPYSDGPIQQKPYSDDPIQQKPIINPISQRDNTSDRVLDIPTDIGIKAQQTNTNSSKNMDDTISKTTSSSKRSSSSLYANLKPHNYDGVKRLCFAPPGKIGVAIEDGPVGVGPVVHKIRPGSALEGILKQGDRIVAVDEIDTSKLSASDITQIMSERNEYRRKISYFTLRSGKLI